MMDNTEARLDLTNRHKAFIEARKVKATHVTISRAFAVELCQPPFEDVNITDEEFDAKGADAIIGRKVCNLMIAIDDNFQDGQFEFEE